RGSTDEPWLLALASIQPVPGPPAPIQMIDLRSDTVTKPTLEMRRAMAEAEVGDDERDGDPTTQRLEARVANLLGKEAALFFPSGVMANQAAVWIQVPRATEIVVDPRSHMVEGEIAGIAALSGAQILPLAPAGEVMTADDVRRARRAAMERGWTASKVFGGAMRQSGIIAAAALYAIEHHIDRLADDHENAHALARMLDGAGGARVVPPDTNIVMIDLAEGRTVAPVQRAAAERGVLISEWT